MAAAAAATAAATAHRLKLVVDPKARRVVFAEASGEAIEFLHSVLLSPYFSLPFDRLTEDACISNAHDLVDELRDIAFFTNISRRPPPQPQRKREEEHFFVCCGGGGNGGSCGRYVAAKSGARCPSCGGEMAVEVPRGCPGASCSDDAAGPGGVEGPGLRCMLMDDLRIMPTNRELSTGCKIAFREKVVSLGYKEAKEILETALQSKTVLTDVFLGKNK